jgi:hypothetical protein
MSPVGRAGLTLSEGSEGSAFEFLREVLKIRKEGRATDAEIIIELCPKGPLARCWDRQPNKVRSEIGLLVERLPRAVKGEVGELHHHPYVHFHRGYVSVPSSGGERG